MTMSMIIHTSGVLPC